MSYELAKNHSPMIMRLLVEHDPNVLKPEAPSIAEAILAQESKYNNGHLFAKFLERNVQGPDKEALIRVFLDEFGYKLDLALEKIDWPRARFHPEAFERLKEYRVLHNFLADRKVVLVKVFHSRR